MCKNLSENIFIISFWNIRFSNLIWLFLKKKPVNIINKSKNYISNIFTWKLMINSVSILKFLLFFWIYKYFFHGLSCISWPLLCFRNIELDECINYLRFLNGCNQNLSKVFCGLKYFILKYIYFTNMFYRSTNIMSVNYFWEIAFSIPKKII